MMERTEDILSLGGPVLAEEMADEDGSPKSTALSEILDFVRGCQDMTPEDIARLCQLGERDIYRYMEFLSMDGHSTASERFITSFRFSTAYLPGSKYSRKDRAGEVWHL